MKKFLLYITLVLFSIIVMLYILKTFVYPIKYFDVIKKEAKNNGIDPYLILSIIKNESNFNIYVNSSKNAKGLMQIMMSTAKDINIMDVDSESIYDIETNIALGCSYFASLVKRYNGNYYLAICAYNAGMGNVDKWIENGNISNRLDIASNVNIPFSETKKYLKKVIYTYKIYKVLYR